MRDVLSSTSAEYENRIKSLGQQIETQEASIARMKEERDQLVAAKNLIDDEVGKLPAPNAASEPATKKPANPSP